MNALLNFPIKPLAEIWFPPFSPSMSSSTPTKRDLKVVTKLLELIREGMKDEDVSIHVKVALGLLTSLFDCGLDEVQNVIKLHVIPQNL